MDKIEGDNRVTGVLARTEGQFHSIVEAKGVFIYVGVDLVTDFKGSEILDECYILTDEFMATSIPESCRRRCGAASLRVRC